MPPVKTKMNRVACMKACSHSLLLAVLVSSCMIHCALAFVPQTGGARLQRALSLSPEEDSWSTRSLSVDRSDLFRPGSAHPDAYLPGSPYATTKNTSLKQRKVPSQGAVPSYLSADRAEVFRPVRPSETSSYAPHVKSMLASRVPTSFDVDVPGHFQTGNAFMSGSPSRQGQAPVASSRPTDRSFASEKFAVDRPDVFRPVRPHERTVQPTRRLSSNFDSKKVRKELPLDRPSADAPARPVSSQPRAKPLSRPIDCLPSFDVDTPGHFESGSAFVSGSVSRSTGATESKVQKGRPPSSLSVDRPSAFTAVSTRPASSRPSRTSQQLGLAFDPYAPTSLDPDQPGAFNLGPDWKK